MCGIAGVFGVPDAAVMAVAMAQGRLQHRGQEAAGCVSSDGAKLFEHRGLGLAEQVFKGLDLKAVLPGTSAVCHLRYSTTGASQSTSNVQPFRRDLPGRGEVAVAHNGNLVDHALIRKRLEESGETFASTSDSEVFLPLMGRSGDEETINALADACAAVEGSFSLLVLTPAAMYAARDPFGMRPLFVAPCGGGWIAGSETAALDMFRTGPWEEVVPGTVMEFTAAGRATLFFAYAEHQRSCAFELGYFMLPASHWRHSVEVIRKKMGRLLGKKNRAEIDMVSPVPDSANSIAIGFAETSGVPFDLPILRNHYYRERTFIQADQLLRQRGVEMKFIPVPDLVAGKRIMLVDDSIVRGNTLRRLTGALRAAGAKEVHLAIGYPPVIHPCHFGIDMQSMEELLAAKMSTEEMRLHFGADSLKFLSVQEWLEIVDDPRAERHCYTCITGEHPFDGNHLVRIGRPKPQT